FLRAINVGGHTVKMPVLRDAFEAMGLGDVKTFIASGNVAFTARTKDARALERRIESALETDLGYRVDTFVRTTDELAAIAAHQPFDGIDPEAKGWRLFIVFAGRSIPAAAAEALTTRSSGTDVFEIRDREIYWLVKGRY